MIQRKQTLWLLLVATVSLLSLKFPIYSGNLVDATGVKQWKELTAATTVPLTVVCGAVAALALVSIFLYKNRPLQVRLVLVNLILSSVLLLLYFLEARNYLEGGYAFTALLALAAPVLLVLSAIGIRKDEKLVKSLDRLR